MIRTRRIVLVLSCAFFGGASAWGSSNWTGAVDGTYSNPLNWSFGVPSNDIPSFPAAPHTTLNVAVSDTWLGIEYFSGAPAYTINLANGALTLAISGSINNNTSFTQKLINTGSATMAFSVASFHGPIDVENNGSGAMTFANMQGGSATLSNNSNGTMTFTDGFHGNTSVILLNGSGSINFTLAPTGEQAEVRNNGTGVVDISGINGTLLIGSIAGTGNFNVGSKILSTGWNNLSTTVSGSISGVGGELNKFGTGTLTLTGNNSYTGRTYIANGILAIFNNGNLGGPAAGLAFSDGGTLQTLAPVAITRNVVFGSGNGVIDTNGFDSTVFGTVTSFGGGGFTKTGLGKLTLTGANGVLPGITISAGTLQGDTSSLRSDIVNNASLVYNQTFNGDFSNLISGTGSVTKMGSGSVTLNVANLYSGETLINEGILRAGFLNAVPSGGVLRLADVSGAAFDLNNFNATLGSLSGGGSSGGTISFGSGVLTVGSNNASTAFGGAMSATSGSLIKTGMGNLTLTGASPTVDVAVNAGTLSGTGTLSRLTNHATVAPGVNGAGTLHAAGYSGPGTLAIVLDGSSHSTLAVSGDAALTGGALAVSGDHFVTGQYSVLTAGSVTGEFSTVSWPTSPLFRFDTLYSPTELKILVELLAFQDLAQSGNQRSVSAALDAAAPAASGDFSTVIDALQALRTGAAAPAALERLSGDSLASFQGVSLGVAAAFTDQMRRRITSAAPVPKPPEMGPVKVAYAGDVGNLGLSDPGGAPSGFWGRGMGFREDIRRNGAIGSPAAQATTSGFQVGYDLISEDDFLLGFSGGYAKTDLDVTDRSTSGKGAAVQSGVYAGYRLGAWFFDGSAAYASSQNEMNRLISFPGFQEEAQSRFKSATYSSAVEAGYQIKARETWVIEPAASVRFSRVKQDAFAESGAPGVDLSVDPRTTDSLVSDLGAGLIHLFGSQSSHPVSAAVRMGWQHELADTDNTLTMQFVQAPAGGDFTVGGTPRSRNAAHFGLDSQIHLTQNLQGFAAYSATLGPGQTTQGIFGGLSLSW